MSVTVPSAPLRAAHRLRLIKSHLAPARSNSSRNPSPSPSLPRSPLGTRQFSASHLRLDAQFSFTTACAFRGKPGSPVYVRPGSVQDSDPAPRGRTGRAGVNHLKQGLDVDHPLSKWRDAQLEKSPNGAGHDWFFIEGVPSSTSTSTSSSSPSPSPSVASEGDDKLTVGGIKGVVLGVADGVGGWEESGVDPSHFAQALMWFARERVRNGQVDPSRGGKGLKTLLEDAFEDVTNEKAILAGSSTACLVALDSATGKLHAANLGDSSFMILRPTRSSQSPSHPSQQPTPPSSPDSPPLPPSTTAAPTAAPTYSVIHSEPSQTHFFNAPYQLSKLPPTRRGGGGESLMDLASDAHATPKEGIQLQRGDVVVVSTDGFGDNVFGEEVEQLCTLVYEKCLESTSSEADGQSPGREANGGGGGGEVDEHLLASSLAQTSLNFARLVSFKKDKVTPFEVEARRYGYGKGSGLGGGKVDDITVVVAVVGGGPGGSQD